jgi:hypothetical protein
MTPLPRPEQVRALAYLKRKGTGAPIELLRQRIADVFADFETMTASVPPSLNRQSPAPDHWSAQEVIDHLIESHRPAVAQLESLLKGLLSVCRSLFPDTQEEEICYDVSSLLRC